jgi:hypothetical protein
MPRFFFNLADGVLIEDNRGSRCNTRADARAFAINLAAEYGRNPKFAKVTDLSILVTDETGVEVYRTPVVTVAVADIIGSAAQQLDEKSPVKDLLRFAEIPGLMKTKDTKS